MGDERWEMGAAECATCEPYTDDTISTESDRLRLELVRASSLVPLE